MLESFSVVRWKFHELSALMWSFEYISTGRLHNEPFGTWRSCAGIRLSETKILCAWTLYGVFKVTTTRNLQLQPETVPFQRRKCSSVSVSSAFPSERSAKAHLIGCKLLFRCVLEMSLVTFLQWNTVASIQQVLLYAFFKFRYSLQRTLGTVSACTRMALMIKQFATERSALKMMTRRKDDATSIISQQLFLLMNCNLYSECSTVCHGCV